MNDKYQPIITRLRNDQPTALLPDFQIECIDAGYARISIEINPSLLNIYGIVHGGALFTLADTAAGIAAFTAGAECVTLSGTMNFLKNAGSGRLKAIARADHLGKHTGMLNVSVYDDNEHLLATSVFTMYYLHH